MKGYGLEVTPEMGAAAKDAAIALEISADEALERLILAIEGYPNLKRRIVESVLRSAELFDRLPTIYEVYARHLGKIPEQLTAGEKQQAILDDILAGVGK